MRYLKACALALALASVVGCGTTNQTLTAEYAYLPVPRTIAEEVTLFRLASAATVETNFNLRYTVVVSTAAGEYFLRATDNAGGRYFAREVSRVWLDYKGVTLLGTKPELLEGGIHVDAAGQPSIYWFWSGSTSPSRVSVPGLAVSILTEVDAGRVQARREREVRELAAELERQRMEEIRARAEKRRLELQAALATAQTLNRVPCSGPQQCDRAFAHAQAYLLKQADMKIQVATPTLIETYNGTADGQVSIRLLRVPATGDRWDIVISAWCQKDEPVQRSTYCMEKLIDAYSGFLPHMQQRP